MINIIDSNDNIFDLKVEALINPVNIIGIMSKGLSREFKIKFPENYKYYHDVCEKKIPEVNIVIGKSLIFYNNNTNQYIINFPIKIA